MIRRILFLVSAALFTAILLMTSACSGGSAPAGETDKVTYTIACPTGDWGFPSPYSMYPRGPGYVRMSMLFDTLVWKNETETVPALAKEWELLPDENAYVFRLRNNLLWHDGQKITADDVVFTFKYLKLHPWPWIDSSLFTKLEKLDAFTIKISMKHPFSPFISNVAGTVPILPKHIWEHVRQPGEYRTPLAAVGSGPFRFKDYNKAQGSYLFESFDGYYLGKPVVDRLIFIRAGVEAGPMMMKKGLIDACGLPPEMVESFRQEGFNIETEPPAWVAKLMFNHKDPLLKNPSFRHALAYAVDRNKIVSIIKRGHAVPGNPGMVPPTHNDWYCPEVETYDYDPARSRRLLEQLGFVKRDNGFYFHPDNPDKSLTLNLITSASRDEFGRLAEMLKSQLALVGIEVAVTSLESKTLDNRVKNWNFQLALSGHGGLGGDPIFLNRMITHSGFNSSRFYSNPELMSLLEVQTTFSSIQKRREILFKIQQIIARELPALCLYYPNWYWGHNGRIDFYYTKGGIASGIPLPLNKLAFIGGTAAGTATTEPSEDIVRKDARHRGDGGNGQVDID
jgi:peptide/nickel transport system substrate-binding protein